MAYTWLTIPVVYKQFCLNRKKNYHIITITTVSEKILKQHLPRCSFIQICFTLFACHLKIFREGILNTVLRKVGIFMWLFFPLPCNLCHCICKHGNYGCKHQIKYFNHDLYLLASAKFIAVYQEISLYTFAASYFPSLPAKKEEQ